MEVEAINAVGAKEGDQIVMHFKSASLFKVSFLLYIFPIALLIVGAVIGQKLATMFGSNSSAPSIILGFGGFLSSVWYIRVKGRRLAQDDSYRPKIIRILR